MCKSVMSVFYLYVFYLYYYQARDADLIYILGNDAVHPEKLWLLSYRHEHN